MGLVMTRAKTHPEFIGTVRARMSLRTTGWQILGYCLINAINTSKERMCGARRERLE